MPTTYERLAASAPVNRQAGLAVAQGDTHERARNPGGPKHWKAPQPLRPVPPTMPDMTGRTYGRLAVVGLLAESEGARAKWLVRCSCGDYEARSTGAVDNASPLDCCDDCRHKAHLRHEAAVAQYGTKAADRMRDDEISRQYAAVGRQWVPGHSSALAAPNPPKPAAAPAPAKPEPAKPAPTARRTISPVRPTQAAEPSVRSHAAQRRPGGPQEAERLARTAREAVMDVVERLAKAGIRGTDLAARMAAEHPRLAPLLAEVLAEMVDEGDVLAIEFAVPDAPVGQAGIERFYLPAGSALRIVERRRRR